MIDTHLHVVPPRLPGVASLCPLLEQDSGLVAEALLQQMQQAGIIQAFAMGCRPASPQDPLGVEDTLTIARKLAPSRRTLYAIGCADPTRTDPEHLRRVERSLETGQVRALKGYLGYLHCSPDHPGYHHYYELADRFRLPFVFHTGDTYSPRAKLRHAHPLLVDEVAVDHPGVRFVLAHLGNPWVLDAAEVVYKNLNVWADLSGIVVGDEQAFAAEERAETIHEAREAIRRAFRYAERPNRFLYGSDWPLVPMQPYRAFIASALPEIHHPQIFEENARMLFRL
jgi:predicted TIM-barrel fold metal-dependent hydrolase